MDTSETYWNMQQCRELEDIIPESAKVYLAGLFDGEGTVSIRRAVTGQRSFKLEIYVTNTHIGVLEWIKQTFGGKIYVYDRKDGVRKPQGKWHAHTRLAYKILKEIYPYLIIKKFHASLGLEFVEKLNRDASWHEKFAQLLKDHQGQEVGCPFPSYGLVQDQIQEMLKPVELHELLDICGEADGIMWKALHEYAESFEQLWLAFYMHEKHGKIWDGEKWIKK